MEDLYGIHHDLTGVGNLSIDGCLVDDHDLLRFQPSVMEEFAAGGGGGGSSEMSDLIKSQVSNHPLYPKLVSAFIECRKVGAPAETASVLEEISKEIAPISGGATCVSEIGDDPELDVFMEAYCEILHKYKEELSKPFNEATTFLTAVESQLSHLCKETLTTTTAITVPFPDEAVGTSEEDLSGGELEAAECRESSGIYSGDQDLKETLLHKYKGYLTNLRKEFLKKRKKGKLPKDAKNVLLNWWNTHYRWPYPTEEEKMRLSEMTGLGQKQISNWFINQRKRHWRPSDDMRFALVEGVSGSIQAPRYFDVAGGTGGV